MLQLLRCLLLPCCARPLCISLLHHYQPPRLRLPRLVASRLFSAAVLLCALGADVNLCEESTGLTPLHSASDPTPLDALLAAPRWLVEGRARGWFTNFRFIPQAGEFWDDRPVPQAPAGAESAAADNRDTPVHSVVRNRSPAIVAALVVSGAERRRRCLSSAAAARCRARCEG